MEASARPKSRLLDGAILAISVAMVIYQLVASQRILLSPWPHQDVHLAFALVLVFLSTMRKHRSRWPLLLLAVLLTLLTTGYIFRYYEPLQLRVGSPTTFDIIVGLVLVAIVLEAAREAFGLVLPAVSSIFILYFFLGQYLPQPFFHPPINLERITTWMAMGFSGVFGSLLGASVDIVFLFILFGCLIQATGVDRFFMEVGKLVGRKLAGGPAHTAVTGSALMGTVTGAVAVNIMVVGSFTIPLMKKAGYRAEQAGAVEAASSTGGQILPPVMGSVAFIMSGFTGLSYGQIALASVIPALLYFFSIGTAVQIQALKLHIKPTPEKVAWREILLRGPQFIISLGVLGFLLLRGSTAANAAFWGIVILIGLNMLRKETRPSLRNIIKSSSEGALMGAQVAVTCAAIGLVTAALDATGLGIRLPTIVLDWSQGLLPIALIITMIIAILLGCGVHTIAVYILVAVVCAPVLLRMGVPLMPAHLFVLYFAVFAYLTPPVALGALIASAVAKSSYTKTAFETFKLVSASLIVPFVFVVEPTLLMASSPDLIRGILTLAITIIGMFAIQTVVYGFYLYRMHLLEIGAMALAVAGLFFWVFSRNYLFLSLGLILFAVVTTTQLLKRRKLAAQVAAPEQRATGAP
ncbi:MAG: TRAP transporter fused permease subunit [Chloroflexi bacterium]|nr:TRAP transporter fused permease subunit [Chloroflexota bacterium]